MIKTSIEDGNTKFEDQSEHLKTLGLHDCVTAALAAGLDNFTTPTPQANEGRIDWAVRKWVTLENGIPVCFLVAYQQMNAHYEILGPRIPLVGALATAPPPDTPKPSPSPVVHTPAVHHAKKTK